MQRQPGVVSQSYDRAVRQLRRFVRQHRPDGPHSRAPHRGREGELPAVTVTPEQRVQCCCDELSSHLQPSCASDAESRWPGNKETFTLLLVYRFLVIVGDKVFITCDPENEYFKMLMILQTRVKE